jgi:quinol monooxygenase YgiN
MVTEIAIIDVHDAVGFAKAFRETGYDLLANTPGCISVKMYQSSEDSLRFIGVNEWESKEAHLENFRGTDRFPAYQNALRAYVAGPPTVQHFSDAMEG